MLLATPKLQGTFMNANLDTIDLVRMFQRAAAELCFASHYAMLLTRQQSRSSFLSKRLPPESEHVRRFVVFALNEKGIASVVEAEYFVV
jgi:hypothetical protein